MAWVRTTEILLLAQVRLATRQKELCVSEVVGQIESLDNIMPTTTG